MVPQSSRHSVAAARRRPARFARLRCDQFEDRITPALFNVHTPFSFTGLNNNGCVAVADLNKDGRSDAILTNFGVDYGSGAGTTISVLYGNASGGFNRINLNTNGTNVSFATVADINGDTWPDVVVTNQNGQNTGSVSVFRNDGAGNLQIVGTPFSTFGVDPSGVVLADVTGDTTLDAIVVNFGRATGPDTFTGNNITIFQGNVDGQGHGNFTFSTGPITTLIPDSGFIPTALAVTDLDGDLVRDIAVTVPAGTANTDNGSVYVFKGTGSGGFAPPNVFDTGGALPLNIQAVDVTGDGKKDLIVANTGDPTSNPDFANGNVGVLLNVSSVGNPSFGIPMSQNANCRGTFAVAVADFDLDGRMDIASVNYGSQTGSPTAFVSVYMGNGTGMFNPGTPGTYNTDPNSATAAPGGQYLAVGNFDANSTPDLIVAQASNRVGLLLNTTVAAQPPRITLTQINDGSAQRSSITSLTIRFDSQVTFTGPVSDAFTLMRNSGGSVSFRATANLIGGVTVVTLDQFAGKPVQFGSLADGRYTLTAIATKISGPGGPLDGNGDGMPGDNYIFGDNQGLFRYFGDANGDRQVDIADFGLFSTTYGLHTGQSGYLAYFDFNGDGTIDIADFGQFAIRMFTMLP